MVLQGGWEPAEMIADPPEKPVWGDINDGTVAIGVPVPDYATQATKTAETPHIPQMGQDAQVWSVLVQAVAELSRRVVALEQRLKETG